MRVNVKGYCVKAHSRRSPHKKGGSKSKTVRINYNTRSKRRKVSAKTLAEEAKDDAYYVNKVLPQRKGTGSSIRSGFFDHAVATMAARFGATGPDPLAPKLTPSTAPVVNLLVPRKKNK